MVQTTGTEGGGSHVPMLRRELGLTGAVVMGLGSIVGTGVFVSIGLAAGIAGPAVIVSIFLAALVALFNALSSAQLAAAHPVSGGTYEYGYEYLHPRLGFMAGWMFVCAKSASAATAALGFAGYFLNLFALPGAWLVPLAMGALAALIAIAVCGVRRSNLANTIIVALTFLGLLAFVTAGTHTLLRGELPDHYRPFWQPEAGASAWEATLHAAALMFVAFTGYGRIATLGEEVHAPETTIPRAILLTLAVSAVLYMAVGVVAIGVAGAGELAAATQSKAAPLETIARRFTIPGVHYLVTVAAMTAMLGVQLNLLLGLSRVVMAMGRRGDMPAVTAKLNRAQTTPAVAVLSVGAIVLGLTAIGSIKTTWSFSAFTVLVYYAITNLAALWLPREKRRYPSILGVLGLLGCLLLAFWIEWPVMAAGGVLILTGLVWQTVAQRLRAKSKQQ
jgi:basic amino acid/polyamine antiporter, APA family